MIVVLFVMITVSCGKSNPAIPDSADLPGDANRMLAIFSDAVLLFGDEEDSTSADISEILQGPGFNWETQYGIPWEDDNPSNEKWAVAVARVNKPNDVYGIEYRFVGEGTNSMSNTIELVDMSDTPITGEIRLPKIASCFF